MINIDSIVNDDFSLDIRKYTPRVEIEGHSRNHEIRIPFSPDGDFRMGRNYACNDSPFKQEITY
jgi:hypothetical protein